MATISLPSRRHAQITGFGAYRPRRVVPNSEIVDLIDSSDEWIRERSGIVQRHVAAPHGEGESITEMSLAASREALAMAGITGDQVGAVIVATVSHPYQTPGVAPLIAAELGTTGAAFDISAACAGYCHAIGLAADSVSAGHTDHVLVIGVERLSDFTNPRDRGTAFIFADGAGAAIVSASDTPGIGPTVWGSDGEQWDVIRQTENWHEVTAQHLDKPHLAMQGQTVFRWAVWGMAPVARKALEAAGIGPEDLDVFIPHQANVRIIDSMAKALKLPDSVVIARDIVTSGNTSAASIPLATHRLYEEGLVKSGDLALQIGFGAGLVYAAQVVRLP